MSNINGDKGPICEVCLGSGRVAYGPWGSRPPKQPCDLCNGTGIQP